MNEAMLYIGAMLIALSTLFLVSALFVAMFNPAYQVAGGKQQSYLRRVWVAFKEL